MTYQHLTVQMFENAKTNGGMIDQTIFKTAQKYGFNSLYFDEISLDIIDDLRSIRATLAQLSMRLPAIKSKRFAVSETHRSAKRPRVSSDWQVHTSDKVQADHREREREQVGFRRATSVSEDQKHSSNVARVHYQKLRSRDVALKGRTCMEKLRGDKGKAMDMCLEKLREPDSDAMEIQKADNTETKAITTHQHSQQSTGIAMATKGPVRFSQQEDKYLRQGIEKFGLRWAVILKCPLHRFEESKVARTLRKRALSLKLI